MSHKLNGTSDTLEVEGIINLNDTESLHLWDWCLSNDEIKEFSVEGNCHCRLHDPLGHEQRKGGAA